MEVNDMHAVTDEREYYICIASVQAASVPCKQKDPGCCKADINSSLCNNSKSDASNDK